MVVVDFPSNRCETETSSERETKKGKLMSVASIL